jgi:hypothetical protein
VTNTISEIVNGLNLQWQEEVRDYIDLERRKNYLTALEMRARNSMALTKSQNYIYKVLQGDRINVPRMKKEFSLDFLRSVRFRNQL